MKIVESWCGGAIAFVQLLTVDFAKLQFPQIILAQRFYSMVNPRNMIQSHCLNSSINLSPMSMHESIQRIVFAMNWLAIPSISVKSTASDA